MDETKLGCETKGGCEISQVAQPEKFRFATVRFFFYFEKKKFKDQILFLFLKKNIFKDNIYIRQNQ